MWVKSPLAIFAENAEGGIVINNGRITELIRKGKKPRTSCDAVFDASDYIVTPGLINVHHHFYQSLTRSYKPALNKELFNYFNVHNNNGKWVCPPTKNSSFAAIETGSPP